MSISKSVLFNTDSYKVSMWKQYPPEVTTVYSYIEARGSDPVLWFGIQAFIREYLTTPITREDVLLANEYWSAHGEPFNLQGWMYIVEKHKGYLPLKISAAKEGLLIPSKNVLAVIENTDPKVWWLTTWVETALLRGVWYTSQVASNSFKIKQLITEYLELSGNPESVGFKLHDFGARGVSSFESAGLGAMAHLVNFMGTDTFTGILAANEYYTADIKATGFSIPAAEHSTITSWGRENESKAYENMLKKFGVPGGIFAVVSDSYDIYEACHKWGALKDQVVASEATLVIRPDSGNPVEVLNKCLDIIESYYGSSTNSKGYFVLNNVRFIWGDGINYDTIEDILYNLVSKKRWSADNFAFGMGGALLQAPMRDDNGWAMKCSAVYKVGNQGGYWSPVYKEPITDPGKTSKKGRVTLFKGLDGEYFTGVEDWVKDELQVVFFNGHLHNETTFEEVRKLAASNIQ